LKDHENTILKLKELGTTQIEYLDLDLEEIIVYMLGGKAFEKFI
jgi:hypothetical protein